MKRTLALILALALCLSLAVPAAAAGSGMDNFQKTNTYTGQFADIPENYWGTKWATVCYEYGLMNGKAANAFVPNGTLSLAEIIVMACRVHQIYQTGESTLTNGNPWYQPYVDYAIEIGLIYPDSFTDYTAPAPRYLMAQLLYCVLPEEELPAINVITELPDVPEDFMYAPGIKALYEAGVLTGSDSYGTFFPASNITRAEAAAVLARLVVPELRQEVLLMKKISVNALEQEGAVAFDFPQNYQTVEELTLRYVDTEKNAEIVTSLSSDPLGEEYLPCADITTCFSSEEIALPFSILYGVQFTATPLRYGNLGAYLIQPKPDSGNLSCDEMYILTFVWEGYLCSINIIGLNFDGLGQEVFDSIELLGSPRTEG